MGFLNLLFAAFFVIAAAYDSAMIYSTLINRFHHRSLHSLKGLLGKIVGLEAIVPTDQMEQGLCINWICDLLLIIWNAADFYQISQSFFLGYSIVGILIGGIYFHHHFVAGQNHSVGWYAKTSWSYDKIARRCFRWIIMDNVYSLLVINLPLALVSVM